MQACKHCTSLSRPEHRPRHFKSARKHKRGVCTRSYPPSGIGAIGPDIIWTDAYVSTKAQAIKSQLLAQVKRLGAQAILPGAQTEKAQIDTLVAELKQLALTTSPQGMAEVTTATPHATISVAQADQQLYGTWQLLYASNGTAVTRTGFAQALITASTKLPGIGVKEIRQTLVKQDPDSILTTNEAVFELGLGSMRIGIEGRWKAIGRDVSSVKVVFEQFRVKPVGVLGLPLPDWLPQLLLALGADSDARGGADWYTTYLDADLRVGEGKSGNLFVFQKVKAS